MDPKVRTFLALLEDFRPATGPEAASDAHARAGQREAHTAREWVVDYEETRLSAAQTNMFAQILGQVGPGQRPARSPYAPIRLRAGIAFDRKA